MQSLSVPVIQQTQLVYSPVGEMAQPKLIVLGILMLLHLISKTALLWWSFVKVLSTPFRDSDQTNHTGWAVKYQYEEKICCQKIVFLVQNSLVKILLEENLVFTECKSALSQFFKGKWKAYDKPLIHAVKLSTKMAHVLKE